MEFDWAPLFVTFKLALITTLVLLLIGVPLAWWLAYSKWRPKFLVEGLVAMPLVLPPSVLGFYLLLLLSEKGVIGSFFKETFNMDIAFTFKGLVIGSVIYSLPFMVQPLQSGFESISTSIREAAFTLGKSRWTTFWKVLLPNIRPSLITGLVLTFAHTIGEFGVVLMIGGVNNADTEVASVAIYRRFNNMDYSDAHIYALILVCISFSILVAVYFLNKRYRTFK